MPDKWAMMKNARKKYGKPLRLVIPMLIKKYGTAVDVAGELGVTPGSVARWLGKHEWEFIDGEWREKEVTP